MWQTNIISTKKSVDLGTAYGLMGTFIAIIMYLALQGSFSTNFDKREHCHNCHNLRVFLGKRLKTFQVCLDQGCPKILIYDLIILALNMIYSSSKDFLSFLFFFVTFFTRIWMWWCLYGDSGSTRGCRG